MPRATKTAPQTLPISDSKKTAQAIVTKPHTEPIEISIPPPIMTIHNPRVMIMSGAFRLNKSKNVWNCIKLFGKLMIANRYISTNMTAAMRNRIFEFDSLAFGLIMSTDAILFPLLLGYDCGGNNSLVLA
jgi:hypothetical protein